MSHFKREDTREKINIKSQHQIKQERLKKPMNTMKKLRNCWSGLKLTLNQGRTHFLKTNKEEQIRV